MLKRFRGIKSRVSTKTPKNLRITANRNLINPFGLASFEDLSSHPQTPVKEAPVKGLLVSEASTLPYVLLLAEEAEGSVQEAEVLKS